MHRKHVRSLTVLASIGLVACGVSEQKEMQAVEPDGKPSVVAPRNERPWQDVLALPSPWERPTFEGMRSLLPTEPQTSPTAESARGDVLRSSVTTLNGGSVDLRPNVLRGKARLTNQNPDILELLKADPWHSNGYASASSTSPGGYSASTYNVKYTSPMEFTFEMLVEAAAGGESGVVYNVSANRGAWYHPFPTLSGARVKPRNLQPEPTEVELTSCLGVVQFRLGTDETCATSPAWAMNAYVSGVNTFLNQGYLTTYVQPGASGRTNLYYTVNTSGGAVQTWVPVEWKNVKCDEIVRICKVPHVPPPPPPPVLGNLTGPFDLLGEPLSYARYVQAHGGPASSSAGHSASGTNVTAPIGDPARWWKLSNLREGDYEMLGQAYLRKAGLIQSP